MKLTPTPCMKCWSCTLVKHTLIHCWRIFPLSGITQVTHFSTLGNVINPFLAHSTDPNLPNGLFLSCDFGGKAAVDFWVVYCGWSGCYLNSDPVTSCPFHQILDLFVIYYVNKKLLYLIFFHLRILTSIRRIKQPNLCFSFLDKWLNWQNLNRE